MESKAELMASPVGILRGVGCNTKDVVCDGCLVSVVGMISISIVISVIMLNSNNGESTISFLNADLKNSKESSGISWKSIDILSLVSPAPKQ